MSPNNNNFENDIKSTEQIIQMDLHLVVMCLGPTFDLYATRTFEFRLDSDGVHWHAIHFARLQMCWIVFKHKRVTNAQRKINKNDF